MYYKVGALRVKPQKVNFILMDGGLGDAVAALPAIRYIKNQYPWINPLVFVQDFFAEFAKNLLPEINIYKYSDMKAKYNPDLPTKTTKWDGVFSPMKIHLLDYAFLKLCDENPAIKFKNYLKLINTQDSRNKYGIYGPYVVVTAGFTAKAREFKAEYVNEITKYLITKSYTPVFLGSTKTITGAKHIIEGNFDKNIDFSIGVNLVNKTSLLEAACIMDDAYAVIGVDNGLMHVAGCTDTPIVGGFPSVSPEIRMPVRKDILGYDFYPIIPDEGCNFCQERTNFLYGHDYRECIYKDDRVINELTADKFIEKLELIL